MDIMGALSGAVELVNGLLDMRKSLLTAQDGEGVEDKLARLYTLLLDAKKEHLAMVDAHVECKTELGRYKAFEAEKDKYALKMLAPHSYAYTKKNIEGEIEPPHHLCASCFQDAKKSILQLSTQEFHWDTLKCPKCGSQVRVPNDIKPTIMSVGPRRDYDPFRDF